MRPTEEAYAFRAALHTDLVRAGELLADNPDLIDASVYGDSETALHFFATEKRVDLVNWLLARGADPNGIAEDDTPLHAAAILGHVEVCQALIAAGAELDRPDFNDGSPLYRAASSSSGQLAVVRLLLAAGAAPDGVDDSDSPLHTAAGLGHEEICRALIDGGAAVDRRVFHETPLHQATAAAHIGIIRMLLQAGADPSAEDIMGEFPLQKAPAGKLAEIVAVYESYS